MIPKHRAAELLIVFVKYPIAGRVKTRLAAGVGEARALAIYRTLVTTTLQAAGGWLAQIDPALRAQASRTVWIYFDPPDREMAVRQWLDPAVVRWVTPPNWVPQPDGDLGEKLQYIYNKAFNASFSAVCAIGTDDPEVSAAALAHAFSALEDSEVAVGPARDGGYYLIGLKDNYKELFINIPWSSDQTLSATRTAASRLGLHLVTLPVHCDIDTEADWHQWQKTKGI